MADEYIKVEDAIKAIIHQTCFDTIEELESARTITNDSWFDGLWDAIEAIKEMDTEDVVPSAGRFTRHDMAVLLAEIFDDRCACNYNDIDEWLPQYCEFVNTCCPEPVGVACWEQFLTWLDKRPKKEGDNADQ